MPTRRSVLPTVRLRRLATELRAMRTAAGLSQKDIETQASISTVTLYKIEKAQARPQKRTLLALLDAYQVRDEAKRNELLALSKESTQLGWLQAYESELPEDLTAYISFESEARSVRNYETSFIPGLLQTERYARAVIAGVLPQAGEDEIDQKVEARRQRQTLLCKENPIHLWAIVDEGALLREVGGGEVMVEQLRHLANQARQPNVVVQVLPFDVGAHPGMPGSFAIMDFPDAADPELVYSDSMAGDLFLERETDVRRFSVIYEHLRAAALHPQDSIRRIRSVAERMSTREGATHE
jgi:transcriptional regulator with XRE-family HTH domain